MGERIIFNSNEIRDLFFQKVLESLNLKNWTEMRKLFNIPKSTSEFYRNGKLTLPEELYNKITLKFNKKDKDFFNKNISFLEENWGRIKAGKATYTKHQNIFNEGREIAIKVVQERANKFNFNMPLTGELAYFLGLFIGDGFLNKYQRYYLIQFTGDKRFEKGYYLDLISKLSRQLFNLVPVVREEKEGNGLRFNLYSKQLFNLITQRFDIPSGRKSRIVLIPKEILEAKPRIIKSCISGLYDAEGCVFFDKRKAYLEPYPRVDLHMLNPLLIKQIFNLLRRFSIPCSTNKDFTRIFIYGNEAVRKFIKEIGFLNPKHLKKLEALKD